jgi:hypothetical protein
MTNPADYYNRFDDSKNYDEHLFIAGRVLQSAEMNEVQEQHNTRLKKIADSLFKDGDVIRDASISVDSATGVVQCQSGAVYIKGSVRGVPPATLTVPITGVVAVGVRLIETVITETEDPDLRDPAAGTRGYFEPGALRLRVMPTWSLSTVGAGEFFPIYTITDGQLDAKEPPPNLDSVTQSLARYDRDSAGGLYVVSGMTVRALDDVGPNQVYTIAEGRARVYGYGIELATARRVTLAAVPDLKAITNEPHLSTGTAAQRVDFDRTPGTAVTAVSITAEKTVTLTHGAFTGAQDPLPDTSVLQILQVQQGAVTYTPTTDYLLTAGRVDWSPAGAEPSPGSTYTVRYRYITTVTPTLVDETGLTVTGAVAGTLILLSYSQKLPRIDRLCMTQDGVPTWVLGISAEFNPQPPSVPGDMLALARVLQTWTPARTVTNDGVRVVPMPQLAAIDGRLDWLAQLIASNRLESSIHTREGGTKKGLFVDPFLDETQRDAGTEQTAAIVAGELRLPISATIYQMGTDIQVPTTLTYTHAATLEQPLRTGSMQINPYMSFAPVPAQMTITPSVDRWTLVQSNWASPLTSRFVIGAGDQSNSTSETRNALLGTTTVPIETLRPISVTYSIAGMGPGEVLTALTFDGVSVLSGSPVANGAGVVSGSFAIPSGIPSGNKLVSASGAGGSRATATFTGQGTLERQVWQQQTTLTETRWQSPPPPTPRLNFSEGSGEGGDGGTDPLAQTFTLTENTQISGIDLWFAARPTTTTGVQIRTTAVGFPDRTILAEAVLQPDAINIGGATTRFVFEHPVHFVAGIEYAIVVLCNDAVGALSVAELGRFDTNAQRWITSQPYTVGVLLSSSNAVTWTAHQDRDMAFRLLRANYTQTARTITLGTAAVVGATDLLLMSYAERPSNLTGVQYRLTLPDASVLLVDDGQPIQLAAPITGNVAVAAILTGNAAFSPVLFPGTQLVAGVIGTTGTYVSRAVPGGNPIRVKTILEAVVPSGATLVVEYKGQDVGDTWTALPQTATRNVDDGFVEFIHEQAGVNEINGVQIRVTMTGATAARPRVRDLRVIVI